MYLLGKEVTIEWEILATDNPPALGDLDFITISPVGLKTYTEAPVDSEDYLPPTSTENGLITQKFTPESEGLWRIHLVTGTEDDYQILSKVEMQVFERSKTLGMELWYMSSGGGSAPGGGWPGHQPPPVYNPYILNAASEYGIYSEGTESDTVVGGLCNYREYIGNNFFIRADGSDIKIKSVVNSDISEFTIPLTDNITDTHLGYFGRYIGDNVWVVSRFLEREETVDEVTTEVFILESYTVTLSGNSLSSSLRNSARLENEFVLEGSSIVPDSLTSSTVITADAKSDNYIFISKIGSNTQILLVNILSGDIWSVGYVNSFYDNMVYGQFLANENTDYFVISAPYGDHNGSIGSVRATVYSYTELGYAEEDSYTYDFNYRNLYLNEEADGKVTTIATGILFDGCGVSSALKIDISGAAPAFTSYSFSSEFNIDFDIRLVSHHEAGSFLATYYDWSGNDKVFKYSLNDEGDFTKTPVITFSGGTTEIERPVSFRLIEDPITDLCVIA